MNNNSSLQMNKKISNSSIIKEKKCFSKGQILAIFIPIGLLALISAIYLPLYLTKHKKNVNILYLIENETDILSENSISNKSNIEEDEFDEFDENVVNYTYATLTPKNGYDNIFIFLGGISEVANKYFYLFKSKETLIPKKTKIYSLAGKIRHITFTEILGHNEPVPGWFNVDKKGNLICDNCSDNYEEAKESLYFILDTIDQISKEEKIAYDNIYIGGFSQGGIMTNYVLLNSRHKLGGYLPFSGYFFDHRFPNNSIPIDLTQEQKEVIKSKKDYHILATFSFNDEVINYEQSAFAYYNYYKDYTNFKLCSFGDLSHDFANQPVFQEVKIWLKERMGK
jgi:predicted esterase